MQNATYIYIFFLKEFLTTIVIIIVEPFRRQLGISIKGLTKPNLQSEPVWPSGKAIYFFHVGWWWWVGREGWGEGEEHVTDENISINTMVY